MATAKTNAKSFYMPSLVGQDVANINIFIAREENEIQRKLLFLFLVSKTLRTSM